MTNLRTAATAALLVGLVTLGASCSRSADGGVFRSADGGDTWEQKVYVGQNGRKIVTIDGVNVEAVFFDPTNTATIYATSKDTGMYKTDTAGDVWTKLPLQDLRMRDLAVNPSQSNLLYAIRESSILQSSDGGYNWEEVYTDTQNAVITRIEIDYYNPDRVFAATSIGTVLLTEDAGSNWRVVHQVTKPIVGLLIDQVDSRTIYVLELDQAVHKSIDGGLTWTNLFDEDQIGELDEDIKKLEPVKYLATDVNDHNTLYLVSKDGLLVTRDAGLTWDVMQTLIEAGADQNEQITNIVTVPGEPAIIYFTVGRLIHKTFDRGVTWKTIENFPSSRIITSLILDPTTTTVLYAGTEEVEDSSGGFLRIPTPSEARNK